MLTHEGHPQDTQVPRIGTYHFRIGFVTDGRLVGIANVHLSQELARF